MLHVSTTTHTAIRRLDLRTSTSPRSRNVGIGLESQSTDASDQPDDDNGDKKVASVVSH